MKLAFIPLSRGLKTWASKMTLNQIAGLMLYSGHQAYGGGMYQNDTYNGKPYKESGLKPMTSTGRRILSLTLISAMY
jgi:beta-glucosidase